MKSLLSSKFGIHFQQATHSLIQKVKYITYFCYSLGSLVNLEKLDISNNQTLDRLPDSVGTMQSLRILDVSKCNLTELPVRYVQVPVHIVRFVLVK